MDDTPAPFDRETVRRRRERAAPGLADSDFLLREVADRLADRLADVTRRFPLALDLGCHTGQLAATLQGRGGIETLLQTDLSERMARRARGPRLAADEEWLPFGPESFDLVLSCLSLHWVNDLPGALLQIRRALKPDGLFLAALLGGETLWELRDSWLHAEAAMESGASPRVSPFASLEDAGQLLQRAGFALPVADADLLTLRYESPFHLMRELRALGEANALAGRRRAPTRRLTLLEMARHYTARHGLPDGRVPATFQVLYLTGWAPHESQQKPLRPGSASQRLADALGGEEKSAGDKARPQRR